ncbi:MAG: bifunctional nuclease family protein [Planctomycetota bacterium]|nr:bifunctional nuclease family protein [Planctomycetota bacterium]
MDFPNEPQIPMRLCNLFLRDNSSQQWLQLAEVDGTRGFPIVIGTNEAHEIQRVLTGTEPPRPMTHQLALESIQALGGQVERVAITDLKDNTFYAQLILRTPDGTEHAIESRPSDALALGLRVGCEIHVAESVLEAVRTDQSGQDPLDDPKDF